MAAFALRMSNGNVFAISAGRMIDPVFPSNNLDRKPSSLCVPVTIGAAFNSSCSSIAT